MPSCHAAQHDHNIKPLIELLINDVPTYCRDCPKGYINYGFNCYNYLKEHERSNYTINSGIEACRAIGNGGELFVPNSPQEAELVVREANENYGVRKTILSLPWKIADFILFLMIVVQA